MNNPVLNNYSMNTVEDVQETARPIAEKLRSGLSVKDITYLGIMVALMEIAKIALAIIPNVELVSLLLIIFTIMMGRKAYLVTIGYAVVECLLWGMGTWVVMYLYTWPILVTIVLLMQRFHIESKWYYATASGMFGLLFGALGALTYVIIGGWSMGFSWWITGIPYDLIHGVSNFIICVLLFDALKKVSKRINT